MKWLHDVLYTLLAREKNECGRAVPVVTVAVRVVREAMEHCKGRESQISRDVWREQQTAVWFWLSVGFSWTIKSWAHSQKSK